MSYRNGVSGCLAVLLLLGSGAVLRAQQQEAPPKLSAPTKPNTLSAEDIAAGWIRLFDGESQFGWKSNAEVNWSVKDGALVADSGPAGLLVTTTEFFDYELACECRLAPGGNSGIFLRSAFQPKSPTDGCYELNLCDDHPSGFNTGSLVGLAKPSVSVKGTGAWKYFQVRCEGPRILVWIDGVQVLDYREERPAAARPTRGYIGLQKNAGLAEYRNVFLKPLGAKPLFNGKDLAGWKVVPGGKSEFTIENGAIKVLNGRGFLETTQDYGDFILQAEIKTLGAGLNSGIFFRAQPGTAEAPSNGYEAQVHNLFKDKDRTKPADFGTGGIYRRVPARRVSANDNEWFTLTVAAQGAHVTAWVNGDPVTDWTDTRKPSDNPREGLRTKPGRFSLQGHDPTTNLLFRNLRVVELDGR